MARTNIEIRAVDKTQQALGNIDARLNRLDKSTAKLQRGFGGLTSKIIAAGAAIGTAFGIKSILRVGADVEKLQLRFQFLFRSVDEGTKAFRTLIKFAGEVPFTLEEIQRGAANLAVVSANADELGENLRLVGNIAAVSGLDFQTAAEQLQRSFSSGIAASELFRERGIKALLGFQDGVSVSIDATRKKFEEAFGPGGPYENAALALASTFDGVFSMLQDKLLRFQIALANEGGLLEFAKSSIGALDTLIAEQFGTLEDFAKVAGARFIEFVKTTVLGTARIIDAVAPIFKFVITGIDNLFSFINQLPGGIREIGLVGFFFLGAKGKLLAIIVGAVLDKVRAGLGKVLEGFANFNQKLLEIRKSLGLVSDEGFAKINAQNESLLETASRLQIPFKELTKETGNSTREIGKFESGALKALAAIDAAGKNQKKQQEEIKKAIGDIAPANAEVEKGLRKISELSKTIGGTLGKELLGQGDARVKALQEAINQFEKLRDIDTANEEKYTKRIQLLKKAQIEAERKATEDKKKEVSRIVELMKQGKLKQEEVEGLGAETRKAIIVQSGKDILSTVAQFNEKAFKLSKAVAIAEATVAVYQGIAQALKLPFPLNLVQGALVAAKGFSALATIKATQYSGPRQKGGMVGPGQSVLVGESGQEVFRPNTAGTIIPNNQLGQNVNVTFNIETVDATGFDDLLVARRGTVVGIINEALNRQGREGITS